MKNQSNALAAAFQNVDLIKEAKDIADTSDGAALKANDKYMDSISGHLNEMAVNAQKFWFYFVDSKLVKSVVDIGTGLLNAATGLAKFLDVLPGSDGMLNAATLALGFYGSVTNKFGRDRMFSLFRV